MQDCRQGCGRRPAIPGEPQRAQQLPSPRGGGGLTSANLPDACALVHAPVLAGLPASLPARRVLRPGCLAVPRCCSLWRIAPGGGASWQLPLGVQPLTLSRAEPRWAATRRLAGPLGGAPRVHAACAACSVHSAALCCGLRLGRSLQEGYLALPVLCLLAAAAAAAVLCQHALLVIPLFKVRGEAAGGAAAGGACPAPQVAQSCRYRTVRQRLQLLWAGWLRAQQL